MSIMLKAIFGVLVFPLGVVAYLRTGETPHRGHMALIHLFCTTGGRFNDWISSLLARRNVSFVLPTQSGVIGQLSQADLDRDVAILREQGYLVFPKALAPETCDRIMQFALETPANVRRMDYESAAIGPRVMHYEAGNPMGIRYDYPVDALLDNTEIQALLADHALLALSQAYLGSRPRADVLSMWWHTNFHSQPDSEAAQFFHFDMDRFKWLKIFIYLTDVGPEDGPHTFVAGSHRTGGIPFDMLKRGYTRLTDDEVIAEYGPERLVEFSAPRGTIIIEDTRGLHKGKHVSGSDRLVLQLQFSNSLFGAIYPKMAIGQVRDPGLADMLRRAPDIYRAFT